MATDAQLTKAIVAAELNLATPGQKELVAKAAAQAGSVGNRAKAALG